MNKLGCLQDKTDPRDYIYGNIFHKINVPPIVDYTPDMNRIRSQGAKGSCVSFALCAVREWQEYIQRGRIQRWDFSEEFLYAHTQVYPGGGSRPRDALKILKNIGIPLERQYPYVRGSDKKKLYPPIKDRNDPISMRMFNSARRFRIKGYVRLKTIDDVMQSLVVNGPCFLGVRWPEGWHNAGGNQSGKTMLTANAGKIGGGHGITIVAGYREERCFKIRNEWGRNWGDDGYAYMTFGGFKQYCIDAWALFDLKNPLLI